MLNSVKRPIYISIYLWDLILQSFWPCSKLNQMVPVLFILHTWTAIWWICNTCSNWIMISLCFLDLCAAFSSKSFCFFVKSSCWFAAASQFWVLETSRPVINTRLIKVKNTMMIECWFYFEKIIFFTKCLICILKMSN